MFDSYSFRFITLEKYSYSIDSNHSSKFSVLIVVAFKKNERKKENDKGSKQSKHTAFY